MEEYQNQAGYGAEEQEGAIYAVGESRHPCLSRGDPDKSGMLAAIRSEGKGDLPRNRKAETEIA
jgi:hypothetical protein